jgi:hypothetical protein
MVPLKGASIILALSLPCNKRKMWEKLLLTASHSKRSSPGGRRTASLKFPLPRVASMCFRSWAPCFQPAQQNMMTSKGSLLVDVVPLKQKLSTPRSLKFCLQPKPLHLSWTWLASPPWPTLQNWKSGPFHMYSHGIVICLLPLGTHEFSPLGEKQFGKIRDFLF